MPKLRRTGEVLLKRAAIFLILSELGCAHGGVLVSPCVLGAKEQVGECASSDKNVKSYTLPLAQMNNFTCVSPDDWQLLLTWIKRHRKGDE